MWIEFGKREENQIVIINRLLEENIYMNLDMKFTNGCSKI